jgi:hypothetical protein
VAGGGVDAAEELVDDLVDGEGGAGAGWGLQGIGSLDCIGLEAVGAAGHRDEGRFRVKPMCIFLYGVELKAKNKEKRMSSLYSKVMK